MIKQMFITKGRLFKSQNKKNNKSYNIQSQNYIRIINEKDKYKKIKLNVKLDNLKKRMKKTNKNKIINKINIEKKLLTKINKDVKNSFIVKRKKDISFKSKLEFRLKNNNDHSIVNYFENNYKKSIKKVIRYIDNKYKFEIKNENSKPYKNKLMFKLKIYLDYSVLIKKKLNIKYGSIIFPSIPFQSKFSNKLIDFCKYEDKFKDVKKLLKFNKFLVLDYDYFGCTPLHWACKRGNINIVKILLRFYTPLNFLDKLERTPYYYSIINGDLEIIKLLLAHHCDTSITKINIKSFNKAKNKIKNYIITKVNFNRIRNNYKKIIKENKDSYWKKELKELSIPYFF